MANPFLGVRIPTELNEAIAARMELTGQSKSEIVIDALRQYLGMLPLQHRLEEMEHRLTALEFALTSHGETVNRESVSVEPPTSRQTPQSITVETSSANPAVSDLDQRHT